MISILTQMLQILVLSPFWLLGLPYNLYNWHGWLDAKIQLLTIWLLVLFILTYFTACTNPVTFSCFLVIAADLVDFNQNHREKPP